MRTGQSLNDRKWGKREVKLYEITPTSKMKGIVSSGSGNEKYYWIAVHFDQRSSVASKMAKLVTKEAFECDPDFCPRCGSILPLPGVSDVVSCILCDFKKDASGNTSQRSFGF